VSVPVLPPIAAIEDLHRELIETFGGTPGLRDRGALEQSLARPLHLMAYGEDLSVIDIAAALCVSLCRNHPFLDGNKRIAFVALGVTLSLNGFDLDAAERDATAVMMDLAAGTLSEEALRAWVARTCVAR
jgi:death-on-curing protein